MAIPSQTQLQEDLPEDVRGRVFGILNMLVSVSSFLPIIIAGTISDLIGTTSVILIVAIATFVTGVASFTLRGPLARDGCPGGPARGGPDRRGPRGGPTDLARGADGPLTPPATRGRADAAGARLTPAGRAPTQSPLEHAGPSDPTDRD